MLKFGQHIFGHLNISAPVM